MAVVLNDPELARAAQRGDSVSLGMLLERHRAPLYALALRVLGYGLQAQDAVQDTFLIAVSTIDRLREPDAVGGWLRGILRNVCLNRLREDRRRVSFDELPRRIEAALSESSVEEAIDRSAMRDWVWTALSELSEPLRVTAMLRYFGSYASYEEISAILSVPVGTVRSRLSRVKVGLAEALLETAGLEHDEALRVPESRTRYKANPSHQETRRIAVYDVIVVGARVAGSSTAMLLAREGLKVLLVDRATFPSDTLSTHQVQLPGVARLKRWGLLERVISSGAPAARRVRFDPGPVVLEGRYPECQGVDAVYSPRRTILDKILVDAAREAGTEVRERFIVEEVLMEEGRVTGIRGRHKNGAPVEETARLVVGADGKRSFVARAVRASAYHQKPALSLGFYAYWEDVPLEGGESYGRDRRAVGAWPTNEGMAMTYVAWPIEEFRAFRSDVEGNFLATLDLAGDLGERVRSGKRIGRFRGTPDLPNFFRKPYGPGWALVGDAGLVMDPITGQGISDAFRDAELLAEAIGAGFDGGQPLDAALEVYEKKRNHEALPMYEFTTELASFAPPKVEEQVLFTSLAGRQAEIDRFLGVLTGTVPMREYLTPKNLLRVIGVGGMAKVMLSKLRSGRPPEPHRQSLAQA